MTTGEGTKAPPPPPPPYAMPFTFQVVPLPPLIPVAALELPPPPPAVFVPEFVAAVPPARPDPLLPPAGAPLSTKKALAPPDPPAELVVDEPRVSDDVVPASPLVAPPAELPEAPPAPPVPTVTVTVLPATTATEESVWTCPPPPPAPAFDTAPPAPLPAPPPPPPPPPTTTASMLVTPEGIVHVHPDELAGKVTNVRLPDVENVGEQATGAEGGIAAACAGCAVTVRPVTAITADSTPPRARRDTTRVLKTPSPHTKVSSASLSFPYRRELTRHRAVPGFTTSRRCWTSLSWLPKMSPDS